MRISRIEYILKILTRHVTGNRTFFGLKFFRFKLLVVISSEMEMDEGRFGKIVVKSSWKVGNRTSIVLKLWTCPTPHVTLQGVHCDHRLIRQFSRSSNRFSLLSCDVSLALCERSLLWVSITYCKKVQNVQAFRLYEIFSNVISKNYQ